MKELWQCIRCECLAGFTPPSPCHGERGVERAAHGGVVWDLEGGAHVHGAQRGLQLLGLDGALHIGVVCAMTLTTLSEHRVFEDIIKTSNSF